MSEDILQMAADIVAAYVSHNRVDLADLPSLLKSTYDKLATLGNPPVEQPTAEPLVPAVSVRRSVTPDYIICLEDGKKLKMLKRHLRSAYNLSPDEYRARWGLPADYPMVAPNYAAHRSGLAKSIGLGTRTQRAAAVEAPAAKSNKKKRSVKAA
ncbi:MucR family transcriptional regulator [Nitrospirillum viridazoti]|uniref:MucR family transcriptional regulator n=1 Tax=Nitrospirillum amazonense TaxID=28077 RepID=A0A560HNX7_9PROT|nr:MucR family transcriptional regulator [Nitrospirillum amazonense]TWB48223.1 MucR family transcriptional regulator [Nitrospirillum amazonense]